MDASAVRHGVGWGWRALAAVFAVVLIGAGVASGPSTGAWVAIGCGILSGIACLWSDASIAVHVDTRGIWPVDPRRAPMEWRAMHEIVQRSNGIEVRDEAGRALYVSTLLRGERELVQRMFRHAVESQRRTFLLPLHLRAENKGPAYVFAWLAAGLLTIAGVGLLLARYEVALLLALSCTLSALWARSLWARRFAETTIDEGGISFLEGVRRRHVPHGVAIALVANDQRQHVLHVWDAQDRVVASFGPSQGLARIAAHLLAARAYVLPVERSGAGSEEDGRDVHRR
jgi:hypothetical protein